MKVTNIHKHAKIIGNEIVNGDYVPSNPKITVIACPPVCQHVFDGPVVEFGAVTSVTCSKCGSTAFDDCLMNAVRAE